MVFSLRLPRPYLEPLPKFLGLHLIWRLGAVWVSAAACDSLDPCFLKYME
jgi:hypothetical protein